MAWNVKVERIAVLDRLRENRANHKDFVLEAWNGYEAAILSELNYLRDLIQKDRRSNIRITLPQPVDHTDEYDTIIGMLEMSEEHTISLGAIEYRSYIEDKWDWKQQFIGTNSRYV